MIGILSWLKIMTPREPGVRWCWHESIYPCSSCFLLLHCEWPRCHKRQKSTIIPIWADGETKQHLDLILKLKAPKAGPPRLCGWKKEKKNLEDDTKQIREAGVYLYPCLKFVKRAGIRLEQIHLRRSRTHVEYARLQMMKTPPSPPPDPWRRPTGAGLQTVSFFFLIDNLKMT